MKNVKLGAYVKGEDTISFHFGTDLSTTEKVAFVRTVVDNLLDDGYYNFVLKDIVFNSTLISVMTDIELDENLDVEVAEQFLEETNVIDIIEANAEYGLIDQLNKAVNFEIEYRTGIHINPLNTALADLVNTLEKKVNEFDLTGMAEMVSKFAGMTEELTVDNIVNAYMNSDMHQKNIEEIADSKNQRKMMAEGLSKVIDIAVEKTKEEIK